MLSSLSLAVTASSKLSAVALPSNAKHHRLVRMLGKIIVIIDIVIIIYYICVNLFCYYQINNMSWCGVNLVLVLVSWQ